MSVLREYERRAAPDVSKIAQVVDTVRGCVGVVPVDDAEVPRLCLITP